MPHGRKAASKTPMDAYADGCRATSISTGHPTRTSRRSSSPPTSRPVNASGSRRHFKPCLLSLVRMSKSASLNLVALRAGIQATRTQTFSNIAEWLSDEFSVCVLLAYDENVTAQAYRLDFPIYRSFGNPGLLKWIRLVALDEVHHFSNLVALIRRSHRHRLNEVAPMLDRLVERDLSGEDYSATFVLDH